MSERGQKPPRRLYRVVFKKTAQRDFQRLDHGARKRITAKLQELLEEPRPLGAKALSGEQNIWRLRVGDYRVVYTIRDKELIVLILRVGHRREIYRLPLPSTEITSEEAGDGAPGGEKKPD